MVKGKFKIADGDKTGRFIFYNQNLQNLNYPNMTAVNIAEAVQFISDLTNEEVTFTGLADFADLISSIPTGTLHTVELFYGKKDFDKKYPKIKIVKEDLFDDATDDDVFQPTDEDIPF